MVWEPSLEGRSLTKLFQQQTKSFCMAGCSREGTTGETAGLEPQPARASSPQFGAVNSVLGWSRVALLHFCQHSAHPVFQRGSCRIHPQGSSEIAPQLSLGQGKKNPNKTERKNPYLSKDQAGSSANTTLGRAQRKLAGELFKTPS